MLAGVRGEILDLPLAGKEMKEFDIIKNAYLVIEGERIAAYGVMSDEQANQYMVDAEQVLDMSTSCIIPGYVDTHTHIIYARSREEEFIDKINGLSYEEIARRGGGILNSAKRLHDCSEDDLFAMAQNRLDAIVRLGTVAMEIKSGYGLNKQDELKMLRVIRRLKKENKVDIKATFLGAHAVPPEYKGRQDEYVQEIINNMLPAVASEGLADYVDVFCDEGFFTVEQTEKILKAAAALGIKPKIHANELAISGGVQVGVKNKAVSVDHLEQMGDEEIEVLRNSGTLPTVLPGTSFFLRIPFAPARKIIDSGLPLVIASDYNPGSCPSGNMNFALSLACIYYRLLPEEALNAITQNAAFAIELQNDYGSISVGKYASFIVTSDIPTLAYLPYSFGENNIQSVFVKGKKIS